MTQTIHRAYRVELDPNNVQRTALLRHAGAARWAYNWGLRQKIDTYQSTGKSPSAIDLHRKLNILKGTSKEEGGCPWMYEVSKCAPQEALRDLDRAFSNFFKRCASGASHKGFPRFKARHKRIGGFRLTGTIQADTRHVHLPRLGALRLKETGYLPLPSKDIKVLSASVTERAGHWFVSLSVEEKRLDLPVPKGEALGIDVGISSLATLSDGTVQENPRALARASDRLRRLQRSVSRKVKGSSNRRKAKEQLVRQHCKVANIRRDAIQKATSAAIHKQPRAIAIETLHVAGMMRNHHIARALSDASVSEYHRCIEYKAAWASIPVVKADRFYASSKTCSACGREHPSLTLADRIFLCPTCGLVIDRDLNAAINLRGLIVGRVPPDLEACGEASSGPRPATRTKLASVKQEPNTIAPGGTDGQVSENGSLGEPCRTSSSPRPNRPTSPRT